MTGAPGGRFSRPDKNLVMSDSVNTRGRFFRLDWAGSEDPFLWRGLGEKKRPPSGGHRFDKGIDRLHGMCCGYFAAYYLLAAEIAVLVWRCLRTGCGRAFFAVILSANLLKHIRPFESWKLADIREWP